MRFSKYMFVLGRGLLESVYCICRGHELRDAWPFGRAEVSVPVIYEGIRIESALRLDLLVEACIVVEVKAVEKMNDLFEAQLLTYLKLTGHRLGFLANFNVPLDQRRDKANYSFPPRVRKLRITKPNLSAFLRALRVLRAFAVNKSGM